MTTRITLYSKVARQLREFADQETDTDRILYAEQLAQRMDKEIEERTDLAAAAIGMAEIEVDRVFDDILKLLEESKADREQLNRRMDESAADRQVIHEKLNDISAKLEQHIVEMRQAAQQAGTLPAEDMTE